MTTFWHPGQYPKVKADGRRQRFRQDTQVYWFVAKRLKYKIRSKLTVAGNDVLNKDCGNLIPLVL